MASRGIIYEYEDGGKYCGEWENDAAHGHGVCTGPNGNGLFQGLWERGNQASGIFTWPSGQKYMGKWRQGVREGSGKETKQDGTEYCGEFTQDSRGPCGVLRQPNGVVYRGTWKDGVQNGEGTELYIDGGMYRGEYRNGLRHGHGTRSSSKYERSTVKESHSTTSSVTSSVDESIDQLTSVLEDPSTLPVTITLTNAQIYEGEWKDDKRHGYGVLKIVGHHTYYGQWEDNMRSGYGVMTYDEEKRKEGGHWQRGKLINKLKRKKLQLKSKQLEAKVNQAHMSALQAAEVARSKADLAEGRAITANARSRAACRASQQAIKDAEIAEGIEKLHKNAPKVQEHMQSPVTGSYTAGDIGANITTALSPNNLLSPPKGVPLTPSFEDLASIARGLITPHINRLDDSSSSNESFEEDDEEEEKRSSTNEDHQWPCHTKPSPDLTRKRQLDVKSKRERFQASRHSSADITILAREKKATAAEDALRSISGKNDDSDLGQKRNILHESHPSFATPLPSTKTYDNKRSVSGSALLQDYRLPPKDNELRPRHINKATGEPDHDDVTDEEEIISSSIKTNPVMSYVKDHAPHAVSVEVLQQMANWNKTVAYLNLGLLVLLLMLIIAVFLCMNYYWLVYQMPHVTSSIPGTTVDDSIVIDPPNLAVGPMA